MRPPVLIVHTRGTNRDLDAAEACELAGGAAEVVHLDTLTDGTRSLLDYRMLVVPGGFSFGDDLGAGRVLALALRTTLRDDVARFVELGRPVLGICNGFQALIHAGLLHGPDESGPFAKVRPATLTRNANGRFECRWVELVPEAHSPCIFTRDLDGPIRCPVAHGEGRVVARDAASLAGLEDVGQVPLRYVHDRYPDNPNGSVHAIAGLCNPAGNVLGLMPHPENHVHPGQAPDGCPVDSMGRVIFDRGVSYAAQL